MFNRSQLRDDDEHKEQNMTNDTLTSCGPGKFGFLVDEILYALSLDGADDNAGSAALFRGPLKLEGPFSDVVPDYLNRLTDADREYLTNGAGFIVDEDSNGFVYVYRYDTESELDAEWGRYVADEAASDET